MQARARFWWTGILLALVVVAGCQSRKPPLDAASADAWAKFVVGHTSGVVSRKAEVRVLFAEDVAAPKALDDATLSIKPAVNGALALRNARELVLTPAAELKPGQEYQVTLAAKGLEGAPQGIEPYQFSFVVQTPQFDVSMAELESDPQDDRRMVLRGTVTTADAEGSSAVESMLRATYRGEGLPATWTHSGDGREHVFTLTGLLRQPQAVVAELVLDGKAIGAARTELRSATVPATGEFAVLNVQAVEDEGRKQIQVSFSDALDESQDLNGLVRFSAGEFTTRIESNRITVYPAAEQNGDVTVTLEAGIRNRRGSRLAATAMHTVKLTSEKPQVRFVGNGVVLPDAKQLTVAFEAVSARSVQVIATRVFPDNIPQFLQMNRLGGNSDIGRVGRYLWRKTLPLGGPRTGRWQRYEIDVTELVQQFPGSLLQLTLQLTPADSAYACPGASESRPTIEINPRLDDQDEQWNPMRISWQYSGEYFGVAEDENPRDYEARWRDRNDPCRNAYYQYGYNQGVQAQRNLIASNFGLLAKADAQGKLLISVTNLATAQSESGVPLELRNYQNQPVGTGTTDSRGMATITPTGTPFLLVAGAGDKRGYLRLGNMTVLPVSHFDVAGERLQKGLKGAIYGERGVWRPGDAIPLTFVVHDREGALPASHPATLELADPRGRVVQTLVNAKPVDGFYRFDARTAADAPTGNWTAKVSIGGTTFSRALKIETVMPNRLRVDLDMGEALLGGGRPLRGALESEWLSGASAGGLKADVKLRLTKAATRFTGFDGYVFDDPARDFNANEEEIFAGTLDAQGKVSFEKPLDLARRAPGMLNAGFTTRVFERGGAFSIRHDARPYAPYARFVGVKVPGDARRRTLQLNEEHTVEIASVAAQGQVAPGRRLSVKLYKVDWRWWWDRGEESLAAFVAREASTRMREDTVTTDAQGRVQWKFQLGESQWGRYLVRVCDEEGGHCAGQVFWIDWPYYEDGREENGPAATMLDLSADKERYQVGETAVIQLPETAQGRALVTVENGSAILDARWVLPGDARRVSIPVTAAMTPNAYVAVTLVQPHADKRNDRPIRLYGVIPLLVSDPATNLKPVLQTAAEWRPESEVSVKVSEASGKPMTYTLAVVDEGLLGLTNFRTPDLHGEFFRREALGIRTWDLFDEVSGAYGTALERLLALGGSDGADANAADKDQSRFPPVAQVLGPFQLPAGRTQEQKVKLPRYVGAVRVMVVAGSAAAKPAAFGSVEKSVPVRQPLMILPTMPRVVGPGEEITVPVSVFAMTDAIRDVDLTITPDQMFQVVGGATTRVSFERTGEKIGLLKLKVSERVGRSRVRFRAVSGRESAQDEIVIEVRSPNPPSTRVQTKLLRPGDTWNAAVQPHGMPGTNTVTLEVSRLPPINLDKRLRYLITYPHGCLEQTTSGVFPQLFLSDLVKLDDDARREVENNVRAGIQRLGLFQFANGGFSYWPGGRFEAIHAYQNWSTVWASHFLIEAEKKGYTVPASMRAGVIRNLRSMVQAWKVTDSAPLMQAYRLFVLARAGQPEVGAMNRLRELQLDGVERWVLAAAYQLAGQAAAARELGSGDPLAARDYRRDDYTFGSPLRDHALVLQSLVILNQLDRAEPVVSEISKALSSEGWYSTQETGWALLAISQLAAGRPGESFSFAQTVGSRTVNVTSAATMHRAAVTGVPDAGGELALRNTSQGILFAAVSVRGTPAVAAEDAAASGLAIRVNYVDASGNPVDITRLKQGEDVTVETEVHNGTREYVRNIALTHMVPSGWEIRNDRLFDADDERGERPARSQWERSMNTQSARADHVDIRDDRVLQYFDLAPGTTIRFQTRINAAYRGRYYLPGIVAEAMYDATQHARTAGRWTEVVAQ